MLQYTSVYQPDSGLVTAYPAPNIVENAVTSCKNTWFEKHVIKGRPAEICLIENPVVGTPYLICQFTLFDKSRYTLLFTTNYIYKLDDNLLQWINISDTIYNGNSWSYSITMNTIIFTNGVDDIKMWTGTGNLSNLGVPYKANIACYFKYHLFLLSTIEAGNCIYQRVRWSNIGTVDDFDSGTAGFVDLVDDSSEIVGASILGDSLIIYKRNSVVECKWTGYTFSFRTILSDFGLISKRGIIQFDNFHIFISSKGLGIIPSSFSKVISIENISNLWNDVNIQFENAIGHYDNKEKAIYFILPYYGGLQKILVFHLAMQAWTQYNFHWPVAAIGQYNQQYIIRWDNNPWGTWDNTKNIRWNETLTSDDLPSTLILDDVGITYQCDRDKVGDCSEWTIDTKDFVPEQQDFIRRLTRWEEFSVEILCKSQATLKLSYSIDKGINWKLFQTTVLPAAEWKRFTANFDVTSQSIRFRISVIGNVQLRWFQVGYVGRRAWK